MYFRLIELIFINLKPLFAFLLMRTASVCALFWKLIDHLLWFDVVAVRLIVDPGWCGML